MRVWFQPYNIGTAMQQLTMTTFVSLWQKTKPPFAQAEIVLATWWQVHHIASSPMIASTLPAQFRLVQMGL